MHKCTYTFNHGVRSYDIMLFLFKELKMLPDARVLDLTYGTGRFYKRLKGRYPIYIIGIDIEKHEWEVKPDEFYLMDFRQFDKPVDVGIIVFDPPWSHVKRRTVSKVLGTYSRPYSLHVDPDSLLLAALSKARKLEKPMIVRFYRPVPNSVIVVEHETKVFDHNGYVYYSVYIPYSVRHRMGL